MANLDEGEIQKQTGRIQLLAEPTDSPALTFNFHGGVRRGTPTMNRNVGLLDSAAFPGRCAVAADDITAERRSPAPLAPATPKRFVVTNWLDRALQLNAVIFYYGWNDLQSFQPLVDPVIGFAVPP